jgi:hypothetical protein
VRRDADAEHSRHNGRAAFAPAEAQLSRGQPRGCPHRAVQSDRGGPGQECGGDLLRTLEVCFGCEFYRRRNSPSKPHQRAHLICLGGQLLPLLRKTREAGEPTKVLSIGGAGLPGKTIESEDDLDWKKAYSRGFTYARKTNIAFWELSFEASNPPG